jgi:hypothetical protein|tara:strand:+ start:3257 stop:4975 length:1719 start_codon:yes stop_codon:yes gene_type:complete
MPEETTNDNAVTPPQCDVCSAECTDEVRSSDDYDCICCDCWDDMHECEFCGSITDESHETVAGDEVCASCAEGCQVCVSCDLYINLSRHDYYEHPQDYEYCCSSCAGDQNMFDCGRCGTEVYYCDSGEDWAENGECYNCYHNRPEEMWDRVSTSVAQSDVPLSKHYESAGQTVRQFYYNFYCNQSGDYAHNDNQLQKSGGGYGKGFGYYNTNIEVASDTIDKMTKHIYKFIRSRRMYCDHRKYGIYNPFVDYFKEAIRFVDEKTGEYIDASAVTMQEFGQNYHDYSVSSIDRVKIGEMLTDDLKNKRLLRNNIIKSLSGSAGKRLPLLLYKDDLFYSDYEKYKTNSAATKLKVRIGFDPEDMSSVLAFNRAVGSCQVRSNQDTYAFGMIDMVTNPHLLYLIYDGDELVGRSVIRLFKHDGNDITYVAPSRLYLSKFTHIKTSLYNSMFSAVQEWADMNFGPEKFQMMAYTTTRHDSAAVWDYLNKSKYAISKGEIDNVRVLYTNWWHQWWNEKPGSDEANFTYYQDESMSTEFGQVKANAGTAGSPRYNYASRERINSRHYYLVEEINNTNE